jgi:hypothetical protein
MHVKKERFYDPKILLLLRSKSSVIGELLGLKFLRRANTVSGDHILLF